MEEVRNKREHSPEHPGLSVTFKHLTNGRQADSTDPENPERGEKPPDNRGSTDVGSYKHDLLEPHFRDEGHESPELQYRPLCGGKRPSLAAYLAGVPAPRAAVEKPFLLSDGRVHLTASLDKGIYSHGEEISVNVHVRNGSNKTVRRIKVGCPRYCPEVGQGFL
ncbi:hypothetical protein HHI36_012300 [Cryptolaemus montrouzieri]|uniref:Arrestin C-terminal-like domain-containing protein n=1 Tax=Cryptolaemus montrouzieri TaxID=559131 RepID=A0ABD2NEU3_9CUCU